MTCKSQVWSEYMSQQRHGQKWLWTLLSIQSLYILAYLGFGFVNNRDNIHEYMYFNLIIMVWLIIFSFFFLRNALSRLLIEELKITLITLVIMCFYISVFYVSNIVKQLTDEGSILDGGSADDHLNRLMLFLDIAGLGVSLVILPLFFTVTYFVYMDMRELIVFHLDGNRIMWQNFIDFTLMRGILKLDVLANLQYFSCFVMFTFNDDIQKEYPIWITIGGFFIISLFVQAFGGYGTVGLIKFQFILILSFPFTRLLQQKIGDTELILLLDLSLNSSKLQLWFAFQYSKGYSGFHFRRVTLTSHHSNI